MTDRVVSCITHGERRPAFVCHHLVHGVGIGFITPNDGTDHDEQTAWCASCEEVRAAEGCWNDRSEANARVTMICSGCFEASRNRNFR